MTAIKHFLISFMLLATGYAAWAQVPVITSFSPLSGNVGTSVTISGSGFNASAGFDKVYFGPVKAAVTYASGNSLIVTVPAGAGFGPIIILNVNSGLMGQSKAFFDPTYSPGKATIAAADFAAKVDFATVSAPGGCATGDIDDDGKPDIAVTNGSVNTVSIFRNTTTGTTISFSRTDFATAGGPSGVALADINGDGKLDLIVTNQTANTVSVFRSSSTVGSIAFLPKVDFATASSPESVAAGDFDGDGKPEIAVVCPSVTTVSILRNTGNVVSVTFAAKVDVSTQAAMVPRAIAIGDLDGDGKYDIAVSRQTNGPCVLRNNCSVGTINFTTFYSIGSGGNSLGLADFDFDNKLDIDLAYSTFTPMKNNCTVGNISFSASGYYSNQNMNATTNCDLNGDGKPDVASVTTNNEFDIFQNVSSLNNISFAGPVYLPAGSQSQGILAVDLDLDGKPDLVSMNWAASTMSVVRNTPAYSTNTNLSSLGISAGSLSPSFSSSTLAYTTIISNGTSSVTVNPWLQDGTATMQVKVNSGSFVALANGATSSALAMNLGLNTIEIKVTAENTTTVKSYFIRVIRELVPPGNALSFDGTNDYTIHSNNITTASFTIEGYLRTSVASYTGTVAYQGSPLVWSDVSGNANDFVLTVLNNKISFWDGNANTGVSGTTNIVDGRWHHFAIVRTAGSSVVIYVDGNSDGTGLAGSAALNANNVMEIGGNTLDNKYFNGSLDEIRIWNSALTAAQLQSNIYTTVNASSSGLIDYFRFDIGTAGGSNTSFNYLTDLTNSGNSGSLINFALTGSTSNWVESYAMVVPAANAATSVTTSGFTANWTAPVTGTVTNYLLDVSTSATFASFVTGYNGLSVAGTSQAVTGLTQTTGYYYRVRADKTSVTGQGNNSNTISATTATPLSTNANLSSITINNGTLTPAFSQNTLSYMVTEINTVFSPMVTATVADGTASLQARTNNGSYSSIGSGTAQNVSAAVGTNTYDLKVTAQDGTVKNYSITILRAAVPPGTALDFDGTNDYVTAATAAATVSGNFTVEAWVRPTHATKNMTIFSTRAGGDLTFDMQILNGNTIHGDIGNGSSWLSTNADATYNYTSGRWFHIAYAVTPAGYTIYVNGLQVGSGTFAGTPLLLNASHIMEIGSYSAVNTYFQGGIDEVRVYNSTLTQANIQFDFVNSGSVNPANLIAQYNFDNGIANGNNNVFNGNVLSNQAGLAYTGTLSGFALTGSTSNWVESYSMVVPVATPASLISSTDFYANWTIPITGFNGITNYFLDVSTDPNFSTLVLNSQNINGINKLVGGLTPGTTYYYRVRASKISVFDQGAYSNTVSVYLPSNNSNLSSLLISSGTLGPVFSPGQHFYNIYLPNSVSTLVVTPTVQDPNATITVALNSGSYNPLASGTPSSPFPLSSGGLTTIRVRVTAQNGYTVTDYALSVYRASSSNANLSSITLSQGTLAPVFNPATTSYTASVPYSVSAVTVTPTFEDLNSSSIQVRINGGAYSTVASGTPSQSLGLNSGSNNTINIWVTAQDQTTKFYTVVVNRAPSPVADLSAVVLSSGVLSPAFTAATTSYTASVAYTSSTITVTPTLADGTASIQVRVNGGSYSGIGNGATSSALALNPGVNNPIDIKVTAQDGTTIKTYTIGVTRAPSPNADLSALTLSSGALSPAFASNTTSYTSTATNITTSVTVTPTRVDVNASIQVRINGGSYATVSSGTASLPLAINVGSNAIDIMVTAQDASTKTYTITVTRLAPSNVNLSALTISAGTLSPAFDPATISYSAGTVSNLPASITITPTLADANATMQVRINNGSYSTVINGSASSALSLLVGSDTIELKVTGQDGTTIKTYSISVTRAPSANADLSMLAISSVILTPAFSPAILSYTSISTSTVTVTPTLADATASVQARANGGTYVTVINGTASSPLALNIGSNIVDVTVTAQDGTTTKTYSITVTTYAPPTITSFSPATGIVGTTVAIVGTNFNATPTNNVVYFGATRATVSAGTTTSLTVTVPTGATYAPVFVLNTGTALSASSKARFAPTFNPHKATISGADFAGRANFVTAGSPQFIAAADMDGDGKSDLLTANSGSGNISILRNTSNVGSIGFATQQLYGTGPGPGYLAVGDIDGDGKLDVAAVNGGSNTISVLRNTGSVGNITFSRVDFTVGSSPQSLALGDLDGDGKPDLAVVNEGNNTVSVLRNVGSIGTLNFAPPVTYNVGPSAYGIAIADINGDEKPDMAVTNYDWYNGSISLFPNTSVSGTISFGNKVDIGDANNGPAMLSFGDLDGDGKLDMTVINYLTNRFSLFRNTSTGGNMSFAGRADYGVGNAPTGITVGDVNGDGKFDVATSSMGANFLSIFPNTTNTVGNISFAGRVDLGTGSYPPQSSYPSMIVIADIDGDGKPDVSSSNSASNTVSIFRNTPGFSTNSNLNNLTINAGTLSPVFSSAVTSYTDSITTTTTSIAVTPTVADVNATIQVRVNGGNYQSVNSGSASSSLSLIAGNNTIDVKVTAQDAVSIKTYTINVNLTTCAPTSSSLSQTVCATSLPYNWNGTDYYSAGNYTIHLPNVGGCDSTATLNLIVNVNPLVGISASADSVCDGSQVTLSGTGATVYSWTGGVVDGIAFTPAATSSYNVVGIDGNGCSSTASQTITVNPLPSVGTSIAPSATVCSGSNVTLAGTGASTYSWSGGVVDGTAFIPVGTSTYTVTGTDANGCTSTATQTVVVNPLPVVSFTLSPASTVCAGTSVTLTGTGAASYSWTNGITDGVSFIPAGTTNYVVTGTDGNGCSNTASQTITVNPLPPVSVSVAPAAIVCTGNLVTLSGTGAVNYSWSGGVIDGTAFTPVGTNTYTVTGTDANGCTNTTTQMVVVNPLPAISVTVSPGSTVCAGTSVTLAGTGAVSYTWTNGITDGASFIPPGTTNYSVTGTDANGCTNTSMQTITVNPLPVVSANASDTAICSGSAVTLTGNGATDYNWMPGSITGTSTTVYPTSDVNYVLTGTDAAGCTGMDTISISVSQNLTPVVSIGASSTSVCTGTNIIFSATVANEGNSPIYEWKVNGVNSGTNSNAYNSSTLNNGDVVTCLLTSSESCVTSAIVTSNSIVVTVSPALTPSVTISSNPGTTICAGTSVSFTAIATNGGATPSYQWKINGGNVGSNSNTFSTSTLNDGDIISCELTSSETCVTSSTVVSNSLIIVLSSPSIAATSATSNALFGQVCSPGSVILTANGGSLGTGASWVWYDGACGGVSVGSGATLTLTPSIGSHNYFVRAEGACGNTACQSVAVSVITAPPSNTIHYTASITDGCVSAPAAAFTVNTVANCTFYNWSSSDAGIRFNGNPSPFQTNTPTVNVTFVGLPAAGTSGWSVCVFGGNACGNTNTICTWVRATVSKPTSITGSVIGCPGSTGNAYSSATVGGAASYQWSATGGMVITGNGSQNITVDFPAGFTSGVLSVHGQTSCGYNGLNFNQTITAIPAQPGTITGTSYPCPNASSPYSIVAVPGAASYTWTTSVPGAVVTGTSNTCSILFPATIPNGSSVSVVANTSCPTSSAVRSKGIATGMPGVPATIIGPASGQCGQTGVSYSISPMPLATGYNWSTTCGTLVGPTNLSGVTVDWPASFTTCTLSVSATNACGTGTARILGVTGAPAIPGVITGNVAPCANTAEFYSTTGSAGATSYTWTVPAGAVILGPANGASILVQWGATSGNITVRGSNACGNSAVRSLPCVISCRLSQVNASQGSFNAEVYPNPASDKATMKFTATSSSQYHLNMTDVLGQNVLSLDGTATEGINMIELNLGSLTKGVYTITLVSRENKDQVRVVIQ